MNFRGALLEQIAANAPIIALLDQYEGAPAIFSPRAPADYDYSPKPAVLIRKPTDLADKDTSTGRWSEILISLVVYALIGKNATDDGDAEDVALMIRELFRGKSFTGGDGLTYTAAVTGPTAAPVDSPQMTGELLQVRLYVGD